MSNVPADWYSDDRSGRRRWPTVVGVIVALLVVGGIATALSSSGQQNAASNSYAAAYDKYIVSPSSADNTLMNSSSVSSETKGINDSISRLQNFAGAVQAISMPGSAQADTKSLLLAATRLQSNLGNLLANVSTGVVNWDAAMSAVNTSQTAFAADNEAVVLDLGLTKSKTSDQTAAAKEIASAIARNAEGMADTSVNANGVLPAATNYVPQAAREAGGTATAMGKRWTVNAAGVSACLYIPDTGYVNPAFTVTAGAC